MRLIAPLVAVALIAAAVITAFVVGRGDGGNGGGGSLEDYFTKVEAALNDENTRFNTLTQPDVNADDTLDDQEKAAVIDFFGQQLSILEDFHAAVQAIEPPEEVAAAHQQGLEAVAGEIELWQQLQPELQAMDSPDDISNLGSGTFDTAEADAVFQSVVDACNALQAIADAKQVTVDLQCSQQ